MPKSVTVVLDVPVRTGVHAFGARPTPYSSFQVNVEPGRRRSRARPAIGTAAPVTGAYHCGDPIEASGGTLPPAAAATASPRFTRP